MDVALNTEPQLISVDWGTTNLRAYLIGADGELIDEVASNQGILNSPQNYPQCLETLIAKWLVPGKPINILLSGMVGSAKGWQEVPHLNSPVSLQRLATNATPIANLQDSPVWIVPGVLGTGVAGLPDVMRGEEIQFFGARQLCAERTAITPGVWCFPGTHNKWIPDGTCIEHFSTSMVGELFELFKQHSLLANSLDSNAAPNETAFHQGVETSAQAGGLAHHLFSVRTLELTGQQPKSHGRDYLSGLIIGYDIAAQLGDTRSHVGVVANTALAERYQIALQLLGHSTIVFEAQAATIAGGLALSQHLAADSQQ